MADKPERAKRDLVVISCTEVRRGTADSGREWVLYNVIATTPDGIPVDKELRSFTKLETTGKPQSFEVEAGEYRGTPTYTLHPIRVAKLGERVEVLERRLLELEERMARLESPASGSGDEPAAGPGGEVW